MENSIENSDAEKKLLNNGLLFNVLRKSKDSDQKIKKVQKYLKQGADVNAIDANDKNNSPLLVAIQKQEEKVVQFLIDNGADVTYKNKEGKCALDIAHSIIPGLKSLYIDQKEIQPELEDAHINIQETSTSNENPTKMEILTYKKSEGTAAIKGQLYEIYLADNVLLNALTNPSLNKFYLGTNVESIGALDDIVYRYNTIDGREGVLFIQAKHKDNPSGSKHKITFEEFLKLRGDFGILKYFNSYLKIKPKFDLHTEDPMFKGSFQDLDCKFIIYTPAAEKIAPEKKKNVQPFDYFSLSNEGKVFQYKYDDEEIDKLIKTFSIQQENEADFKVFLNELVFYSDQPQEDKLENKLIEIVDKFNRKRKRDGIKLMEIESKAIFLKFHNKMLDWWKQPNEANYLTESCQYFQQAKDEIISSPLLNVLNFIYAQHLNNTVGQLEFEDNVVDSLESIISVNEKIVSIVTKQIEFSCIKLNKYFSNKAITNCALIDTKSVQHYLKDFLNELNTARTNLLVLVYDYKINNCELLHKISQAFKGKIIILTNRAIMSQDIVENIDTNIYFNDLSSSYRDKLLNDTMVIFQGEKKCLGEVIDIDFYKFLDSEVLWNLLQQGEIKIGESLTNKRFDRIQKYYVESSVCRGITIKISEQCIEEFNIIKGFESNQNVVLNERDIILLCDNDSDFEKVCNQYKTHNVHRFTYDNDMYVWIESKGTLVNLLKYVDRNFLVTQTLKPTSFKDFNDKIVIIGGVPGMGKTTLVSQLAIQTKREDTSLWVSNINLLNTCDLLKEWKENKVNINIIEVVKFLYKTVGFSFFNKLVATKNERINALSKHVSVNDDKEIYCESQNSGLFGLDLLEFELFNHLYNIGRLILIFDGFDEVCPEYQHEFISLLNVLKESRVSQLIVTTRLYNDLLNNLENNLSTFAYSIVPWSYDEQKNFLLLFWVDPTIINYSSNSVVQISKVSHTRKIRPTSCFIENILRAFMIFFGDQFLNIPLHLFIAAKIFQEWREEIIIPDQLKSSNSLDLDNVFKSPFSDKKITLTDIYKEFLKRKFIEINMSEKNSLSIAKPGVKHMVESLETFFIKGHERCGALELFGERNKDILFTKKDKILLQKFINSVKCWKEKTGIIDQIVDNKPKFVHYSYAEFCAIEFVCAKLIEGNCSSSFWMCFLKTVFGDYNRGLLRFFDAKLEKEKQLLQLQHETFIAEYLMSSSDFALANIFSDLFEDEFHNSMIFLLKCLKCYLTKNNFNQFLKMVTIRKTCFICSVSNYRSNKNLQICVLTLIIKNIESVSVINEFQCSDGSNILDWVYDLCFRTLFVTSVTNSFLDMIENSPSDVITLFFSLSFIRKRSPLYVLIKELKSQFFERLNNIFNKLSSDQIFDIFSIPDINGKVITHFAAGHNNYEFLNRIETMLGIEKFKQVCKIIDKRGLISIQYLEYNDKNQESIQVLLRKLYDDVDERNDMLNFIKLNREVLSPFDSLKYLVSRYIH